MWKTSQQHLKYWISRNIDWKKAYFDTWNHPHRDLIINRLRQFKFGSLLEIGCASGPNLYRIQQAFPEVQLGGVDVNEQALNTAKQLLPAISERLFTGYSHHIFFSDKSSDIVLSDMTLIYAGKDRIKESIKEFKRVARNGIVLCEFHHTNPFKRLWLKLNSGYNAYNYQKLLDEYGFYDIQITKIPEQSWPGGQPQRSFAYLISARL